METLKITSKVVNAKFIGLDFDCMTEYNNAAEGRKRVQARFTAVASNDATENALTAFFKAHVSNSVYSVILSFDNVKGATGQLITDAEITAQVNALIKQAGDIVPLTIVSVPVSCVSDYTDVWDVDTGIRISQRTIAFIGVNASYEAIAEGQVRNRIARQLSDGTLTTSDPKVATTTANATLVG